METIIRAHHYTQFKVIDTFLYKRTANKFLGKSYSE